MKKRKLTATRIIMLGFFLGAVAGAVCLMLPFSVRRGQRLDFLDGLFVAVSSICVTGLSTGNIGAAFSGFGQGGILLLIPFGGFGIVSFCPLVVGGVGGSVYLPGGN